MQSYKPGDTLSVDLAWRAQAEMETSYRVFAHLVDTGGRVVAQSDGEPKDWIRPTTGWLQDEVVTESRVLVIPEGENAGSYRILVGLYTVDGTRLVLPSGEDAFELTRIQVSDGQD